MNKSLISLIETNAHPDFSALYKARSITEHRVNSARKAISLLKKQSVDYVVAQFFYGYSNNYAGVNISNLDVLFMSLQRYSPDTKIILLVDKSELQYVEHLTTIMPIYAVMVYPIKASLMAEVLDK